MRNPTCFAKKGLRWHLNKLLKDLDSTDFIEKGVYQASDLPELAMLCIPAECWRTLNAPPSMTPVKFITVKDLQRELPRLRALRATLN